MREREKEDRRIERERERGRQYAEGVWCVTLSLEEESLTDKVRVRCNQYKLQAKRDLRHGKWHGTQ